MGFHTCEYCHQGDEDRNWYPNTSSGDVTLAFDTGRVWQMPDMILHYIQDHRFLPPAAFVNDVMNHELVLSGSERLQTKSAVPAPEKVGYLHGPFDTGQIHKLFIARLEFLMNGAARKGHRNQYWSV